MSQPPSGSPFARTEVCADGLAMVWVGGDWNLDDSLPQVVIRGDRVKVVAEGLGDFDSSLPAWLHAHGKHIREFDLTALPDRLQSLVRMAEKAALNVAALTGTGPGGRVVARDVAAAAAAPVSAAPSGPINVAVAPPADGKGIQPDADIPVGGMRATIARRLLESKNTVPHFYLEVEVDAAPLMGLRETLNKRLAEQGGETALKLSVNDFILKASAEALRRVPAVNASWAGTSIRQHSAVHLSFGVALEDGLVTPVIRDAHAKSLRDIATDAKALIGKARSKKLSPAEMSGSTFTVTNLGMYGVTGFFGIINVPNAAILSVGATIKKPVIDANDRIVMGHRMVIGLSGDHRVVDGANGAQFLQALKQILEEPTLILI